MNTDKMDQKREQNKKKILDIINSPEDIKSLNYLELAELAQEIRGFLLDNVSKCGGHLASNLGVVELTIALHKVFDTPKDKIVWDVGHQSYVHKILTGRKEQFDTLRQYGGLSGFPKTTESEHDCFNTGHSSTSISAALGMAKARDIKKEESAVVAVIGDGALSGGMAFEALNDAGRSPNDLIVILNDNEMSISKNVGGLAKYLAEMRIRPVYFKAKEDLDKMLKRLPRIGKKASFAFSKARNTIKFIILPGSFFEELGFKYYGPVDGHNIPEIVRSLKIAQKLKGPVLLHVYTQKGKGYTYAEKTPEKFHGIAPFEAETGEVKNCNNGLSYSKVFGQKLLELAEKNSEIVAITAAMPHGTGLIEFSKKYPNRFFDVGIAEQHAITFAAGLAKSGLKPVVAVYSTFLQRAYDQLLHDVALQNLPVVVAIDRAGAVGEDGETHQGIYDLSFLNHIPNFTILAPCNAEELKLMLEYSINYDKGPIAIRYPRGNTNYCGTISQPIEYGKAVLLTEGTDVTILAAGNMIETALKAGEILKQNGISAEIIYSRFIKPLDKDLVCASAEKTGTVATIEDNIKIGGFGTSVIELLNTSGIKIPVLVSGFPDAPLEHGPKDVLHKKYGMDPVSFADNIMEQLGRR